MTVVNFWASWCVPCVRGASAADRTRRSAPASRVVRRQLQGRPGARAPLPRPLRQSVRGRRRRRATAAPPSSGASTACPRRSSSTARARSSTSTSARSRRRARDEAHARHRRRARPRCGADALSRARSRSAVARRRSVPRMTPATTSSPSSETQAPQRERVSSPRATPYSGKNSPREWLSTDSVPVAMSK